MEHFSALLLSVGGHCSQFGLELEPYLPWYAWVLHLAGGGALHSTCTRMIDTSKTLPLALIGEVDSSKSNWGHWVELQTW